MSGLPSIYPHTHGSAPSPAGREVEISRRVDKAPRGTIQIWDATLNPIAKISPTQTKDREAVSCYKDLNAACQFFKELYGEDILQPDGLPVCIRDSWYENTSFWDVKQDTVFFGTASSEYLKTLHLDSDLVVHEVAHRMINRMTDIPYLKEWAALRESWSDTYAIIFKQRVVGVKPTSEKADWGFARAMFVDTKKGYALRSFYDPASKGYIHPKLNYGPYPDHYDHLDVKEFDLYGAHINCSIVNFAFYKFCIALDEEIWSMPAKIWHEAIKLTQFPDGFHGFAANTLKAASQLGYHNVIPLLRQAWEEVGIDPDHPKLFSKLWGEAPAPSVASAHSAFPQLARKTSNPSIPKALIFLGVAVTVLAIACYALQQNRSF